MRKWMIPAVLVYLAARRRHRSRRVRARTGSPTAAIPAAPDILRSVKSPKRTSAGLKEVWRFETPEGGRLQTTPLIVDGTMYVVTPRQKVVALDAATGQQKWTFDSGAARRRRRAG